MTDLLKSSQNQHYQSLKSKTYEKDSIRIGRTVVIDNLQQHHSPLYHRHRLSNVIATTEGQMEN